MSLVARSQLIEMLCPPIAVKLCEMLVDEFVSAERRYIQRDWEPAQLDGGQFAEVAARIYYNADADANTVSKNFDECLKYVENDQVNHKVQPRQNCLHVARVLRTIYKFRSQRGAVHISVNYAPNHMDSKYVIESLRWVMSETLRIFGTGNRDTIAKYIRELLQFDVPAIGKFGDKILVQRTDLTAEEEILLILHYGGDSGLSRSEIGKAAEVSPPSITRALQKLVSSQSRQVVQLANQKYRLTDLGSKRVRDSLSAKLSLA